MFITKRYTLHPDTTLVQDTRETQECTQHLTSLRNYARVGARIAVAKRTPTLTLWKKPDVTGDTHIVETGSMCNLVSQTYFSLYSRLERT